MSHTTTQLTPLSHSLQMWRLIVDIALKHDDGRVARTSENVDPLIDLADHRSEVWRDGYLRHGQPVPLDDVEMHIVPHVEETDRCSGFTLHARGPGNREESRRFPLTSLQHVAERGALRLSPNSSATYVYELRSEDAPATAGELISAEDDEPLEVRTEEEPLYYLEVAIGDLVARGRLTGLASAETESDFPVFFTGKVLERCETLSRRGANEVPPVETGAALAGCPIRCPETGEFGVVVTDCLELWGVESGATKITYSGQTWAGVQQMIRRRQKRCPAERITGQCHGHPFDRKLFVDLPPCEKCSDLSQPCSRHNVAPSPEDRNWHRAVFAGRAPYQICLIYGYDRRGPRHGCFTLHNGQLTERPYYVIDDFDPTACALRSINPNP